MKDMRTMEINKREMIDVGVWTDTLKVTLVYKIDLNMISAEDRAFVANISEQMHAYGAHAYDAKDDRKEGTNQ